MSTFKTITQRRRERLAEHGADLLAEFQRLYCRHGYDLKLDSQTDSTWFAATSAASILRNYVEEGELEKIEKILNLETT